MTAAIRIPEVEDKVVAVLGLARSGRAAAEALAASGAIVWAWDDSEAARLATPAPFVVDLNKADWSHVVALLMSPGIPTTFPKPHPIVATAKAAGVPLISDIELLHRAQPRAKFVGITGTNGKSTVTTLIGHILRSAGRKAEVGGNLGQAVLTLPPLGPDGIYVVELSSYQLDITPTPVCDIAVLLNSANTPPAQKEAMISDVESILQKGGASADNSSAVAADLKTVTEEVKPPAK